VPPKKTKRRRRRGGGGGRRRRTEVLYMHGSDSGVGIDIQNIFNMSVFLDACVSLPSRPSVCLRLCTCNARTAKPIFMKFDTGEFDEKLLAISIFFRFGQF
jgi:hypothetical protein